jgi:hypothetical protein
MVHARASTDPWGTPLPAGRHELVLSQLGQASRNVAEEGFILFVAEGGVPLLEQWFAELMRSAEESRAAEIVGQQGVGYEQACTLLDSVRSGKRGETPRLSEEQSAGLVRVSAKDLMGEERFVVEGVECWRVMWNVKE